MTFATLLTFAAVPLSLAISASQMVHCSQSTRFTVLTPMVIRAEYNQQANFEDKPTQVFLFRDKDRVAVPAFTVNILLSNRDHAHYLSFAHVFVPPH